MTTTTLSKPSKPPPKIGKTRAWAKDRPVRIAEYHDMGHWSMPMRSRYVPDWQATLKEAGYPTTVLVLDFETYFDEKYSLRRKEWSTIEYVMADQFEVLGLAGCSVSQPFTEYDRVAEWHGGEAHTESYLNRLKALYGPNLDGCTVVIQNARFDLAVLAYRYGIRPRYVIDTLGLARHWNARRRNDLGSLTEHFGLPAKGDTMEFSGWTHRRRHFRKGRGKKAGPPMQRPRITPAMDKQLGDYALNDVIREWEIFVLLLGNLSNPATELRIMYETLKLFTSPRIMVDQERGTTLIGRMQEKLDSILDAVGLTPTQLRGRYFDDYLFQLLADHGGERHAHTFTKPAKCKDGWKIASANDDPEREELLAHPDPAVQQVMHAKAAVHSWPNHIARVQRIMAQASANDGVLPVPLKYHGAHTGRWAGGEYINLQNLGKRNPEQLIRDMRKLLAPPPGYKIIAADASQIEGRGVNWVAQQDDILDKFRRLDADPDSPIDVYTDFASLVLGKKIRKPRPDGVPPVEKYMKWARNAVGKVGELGCGYGMGAAKAESYAAGALDSTMAQAVVTKYRESHNKVVQLWGDLEKAFVYTAKYRRPCEMQYGVRFEHRDDCDVLMVLPNGREIKYHNVRIRNDGKFGGESVSVYNPKLHNWGHIWGGHLAENLVQGFCRDIFGEAWIRMVDRGVSIQLLVHDEVVGVAPEDQAEEHLAIMIEELRRPASWAPGMPLNAEGDVLNYYGEFD